MIAGSWRSCIKPDNRPQDKKKYPKIKHGESVCGCVDPQKAHEDRVKVVNFFFLHLSRIGLKCNQHRPVLNPRDWSETGRRANDCHQAQDNLLLLRVRINNISYKR